MQDRLSEYYQPIGQFTLCEWELDCVDCHTAREAMGDGDIYGSQADARHTECRTCHGTLTEPPTLVTITDPDEEVLRQAKVNGKYKLQVGDQVVVTDRGEKLGHVRRTGDHLELTMKATGQTYAVPPVQGSKLRAEARRAGLTLLPRVPRLPRANARRVVDGRFYNIL